MPVHPAERKLAAIFAADIAGYSRLMARDEVGTLTRLKAYRAIIEEMSIGSCVDVWYDDVCVCPMYREHLHDCGGGLSDRCPPVGDFRATVEKMLVGHREVYHA